MKVITGAHCDIVPDEEYWTGFMRRLLGHQRIINTIRENSPCDPSLTKIMRREFVESLSYLRYFCPRELLKRMLRERRSW